MKRRQITTSHKFIMESITTYIPERLQSPGMKNFFNNIKIGPRFVVDAVFLLYISEWGHDFTEYRQFSELRNKFKEVPIMALTATTRES